MWSMTEKLPLEPQHQQTNLEDQYGKIGIKAVAAALRYKSNGKNRAYAPFVPRADGGAGQLPGSWRP